MSFFSWLQNRTSTRTQRWDGFQIRPTARRFRPQLEALEDRYVPSSLKHHVPPPPPAALTVTNLNDSGPGSLRYEIAQATSTNNTIVFDKSLLGRTINLYSELYITSGVTIQGPGAGLLTLTTSYNWGDPWGQSMRVFEVNASQPVVISGLTISDNYVNDQGGGILNHTTLTLSGCNISNNGAGTYGGGIANLGTMTVAGCSFTGDSAGYDGGAIYNAGTLKVGTSTFVWDDIYGSYTDGGGNTFITGRPQVGSFTANASSVTAGSSLTLTLTNITDPNPNSYITEVAIYPPNTIGGNPLGYATQTSPGVWTLTFSTAGWAPGSDSFSAEVVDNYGTWSYATGPTVQVS
jgi:hypothetical protein